MYGNSAGPLETSIIYHYTALQGLELAALVLRDLAKSVAASR